MISTQLIRTSVECKGVLPTPGVEEVARHAVALLASLQVDVSEAFEEEYYGMLSLPAFLATDPAERSSALASTDSVSACEAAGLALTRTRQAALRTPEGPRPPKAVVLYIRGAILYGEMGAAVSVCPRRMLTPLNPCAIYTRPPSTRSLHHPRLLLLLLEAGH